MTAVGAMLARAVNVALPSIEEDLGAGYSALEWVLAANFLGLGAFIIIAGRIADARISAALKVGTLLVVGGTALSAVATEVWMLIVGQAAAGLGAGMQISVTFSATTRLTPKERLGRVVASRATVVAVAGVAGFVVGGVLVGLLGWRAIFYLALPLLVVAGLVAITLLASLGDSKAPVRVPVATAALLALGLALVMLALNRNASWGWVPVCLTVGIVGLAALGLFGALDRRDAEPLVPGDLVGTRAYLGGLVLRSVALMLFVSFTFFLTAFLQNVQSFHAEEVGLLLAPLAALGLIVAPLSGRLIDRSGPLPAAVIGLGLVAVALVLLAGVDAEATYLGRLLPALVLWGAGLALVLPAAMTSALRSVGRRAGGVASSLVNAAGFVFAAVGITAMGLIFHAVADGRLDGALERQGLSLPAGERDNLETLIGTKGIGDELSQLDLATATSVDQAVRDAFVDAFDATMTAMLVLVLVALALAVWLFRDRTPGRPPAWRRALGAARARRRLTLAACGAVVLALAAVGVAIAASGDPERGGATVAGPRLAIYTSLPLTGDEREPALDVLRAERMALEEARARAGGRSVELVVLDDASPATGRWSPALVRANATRAARDPRSVAYVGEFNSGATARALPVLNRAGILQVSPASTAIGLTRADAGDDGSPDKYYPAGTRTFARVVQNDRVQAQAMLLYVKQNDARSLAVVHDPGTYGSGLAHELERFSWRKGVEVVADIELDAGGDARAVARRVVAAGADAMVFCGPQSATPVALFRAVHAADPALALFGSDGLATPAFTRRLGPAAAATRITAPTRAPGTYPPSGDRFLAAFERRFDQQPDPFAIYGYEAMRAVLDSIDRAASGDPAAPIARGRVADAFFAIEDRDSPLGIYSIDDNGDTTLAYYAGFVVRRGRLVYDSG